MNMKRCDSTSNRTGTRARTRRFAVSSTLIGEKHDSRLPLDHLAHQSLLILGLNDRLLRQDAQLRLYSRDVSSSLLQHGQLVLRQRLGRLSVNARGREVVEHAKRALVCGSKDGDGVDDGLQAGNAGRRLERPTD